MALECPPDTLENELEALLSPSMFPFGKLGESARYSLLGGGKRIRPRLVLATAQGYGVPLEKAMQPACALELVHTYSLIHDDLPCMDNDDFRRGKPSLHKAYPEAHALLTGDFLLTYAFQILSESPHLTDVQRNSLVRTLTLRAGANGMVGGQEGDLFFTGKSLAWDELEEIHRKKTAALFSCALEFGGIVADSPAVPQLAQIGELLGLFFQIADDLTDTDDRAKEKPSALSLLGKERAGEIAHNLFAEALSQIRALSTPLPALESVVCEMNLKTGAPVFRMKR